MHALWKSLATSACLALTLAGCSSPQEATAPTTAPVSTPSPPEPSIGPDGRSLPGFVTVAVDLPDAQRLSNDVLTSAGKGWALGIYRPSIERRETTEAPAGPTDRTQKADHQVIYLATPEGARFQLLELDPEPALRLLDWEAGSTSALVLECAETCGTGTHATLDLLTGKLTPIDDFPESLGAPSVRVGDTSFWIETGLEAMGLMSDQSWVLRNDTWTQVADGTAYFPLGTNRGVSPDNQHLALGRLVLGELSSFTVAPTVLSLDSLEMTAAPLGDGVADCRSARWLDSSTLVLDCSRGPGLIAWHIDSQTIAPFTEPSFVLGSGKPKVRPSVEFPDGSAAGEFLDDDPHWAVGYDDGVSTRKLVATDEQGKPLLNAAFLNSSASTVMMGATNDASPYSITSVHLWTLGDDAPVIAFPEVTDWPSPQPDPTQFKVASLTSYLLAR